MYLLILRRFVLINSSKKNDVEEHVRLFIIFSKTSGMKINWDKSCNYWFDQFTHKPVWLQGYDWQWAEEEDLSKLLGTHFDLQLNIHDVNQFYTTRYPINLIIGVL